MISSVAHTHTYIYIAGTIVYSRLAKYMLSTWGAADCMFFHQMLFIRVEGLGREDAVHSAVHRLPDLFAVRVGGPAAPAAIGCWPVFVAFDVPYMIPGQACSG